jgi:ubiquinone/menaquinone biosynthesis C-methylase UbiE
MSNRLVNASGTPWGRLARALRRLVPAGRRDAASAYDLWASTYDTDDDNLLVLLDEELFAGLLRRVDLRGKRVVDVGCGTGRHWGKILAGGPAALVGYDVSPGMLARLRGKHPGATAHQGTAEALAHTAPGGCDLVVSTLALSHVPSAEAAIVEWARVLPEGGEVLFTDMHPAAAAVSETTFVHAGRVIAVEKHLHPVAEVEAALARSGFQVLAREERVIDESVRPHYERAGKGVVFQRLRGTPLLYGMHLRKQNREP